MKGLSRSALRKVDADIALPEGTISDKRAEDLKALTVVDESVYVTLREVFEGTDLLADQRKMKMLLKLRIDVAVAWSHTRDAFIEIGRALNDVDRELGPIERDRFRIGFRRLFPFSETVASQFRAISRAVDDGHLPRELVPGSYGAAYQMALLTPGQREIARERGMIRPDVSRDALIEFRREIVAMHLREPRGLDAAKLRVELARLDRLRRKTINDLLTMRRRMREIRSLINGTASRQAE